MSWTPYDHEAEERRDSERFADPSVFDGPEPADYTELDNPGFEDGEPWQVDPTSNAYWDKFMTPHKPDMIDENDVWKGLLVLLVAVLLAFMFWILLGTAIVKWWPF